MVWVVGGSLFVGGDDIDRGSKRHGRSCVIGRPTLGGLGGTTSGMTTKLLEKASKCGRACQASSLCPLPVPSVCAGKFRGLRRLSAITSFSLQTADVRPIKQCEILLSTYQQDKEQTPPMSTLQIIIMRASASGESPKNS
jgi:hypothetical protein